MRFLRSLATCPSLSIVSLSPLKPFEVVGRVWPATHSKRVSGLVSPIPIAGPEPESYGPEPELYDVEPECYGPEPESCEIPRPLYPARGKS